MAGGKGQRLSLSGVEKPLLVFAGKPLVAYVVAALTRSQIESFVLVTSPYTPCTTRWAQSSHIPVLSAPGRGYVEDYTWAMKRLGFQGPILIISADLPLINHQLIDKIIAYYEAAQKPALGVYVPLEFYEEVMGNPELAVRTDAKPLVPCGINIIDASMPNQLQPETALVLRDASLLYNVNRRSDLKRLAQKADQSEAQNLEWRL
jgi:uncharacterized protein (TIGR00454 family)